MSSLEQMVRRFLPWLALSAEPKVVIAQYRELKRQVPLLYALLLVNALAVIYTHWQFAPLWLTMGYGGLLIALSCSRMLYWILADDISRTTAADATRALRRTILNAPAAGAAFVIWSLMMDGYGGDMEHGHVALFIGVTVLGCIFCLASLPQAAVVLTVTVTIPYLLYYLLQGQTVMIAMAFNMALVTIVLIRALLNSFGGFVTLIHSKEVLANKQREAEQLSIENAHLANTDPLTGLPNRRYFFAKLDQLLTACRQDGRRLAIGVVDLDRFKPINDSFGHHVGDRLLVEVGRRLAELSGGDLHIARLGGDEFGILLAQDAEQACTIGHAICAAISASYVIDEHRISLGASAGFSSFPDTGLTAHELFDRADYALYHVKLTGGGGCAAFSLEHETIIRSERAVETALQSADLASELAVLFQPIVCTRTLKIGMVEALGRWTSPIVGSIPPDRFITAAERLGIIHEITATLFGKALHEFQALPCGIGLSFNLSAHDIASAGTIARVIDLVCRSGIDPTRITFELTETALMRDFDAAAQGIQSLRKLGAQVALDDFGTGYSSLVCLQQLPLDKVKIDRSFVGSLDKDAGRSIVTAILGLCNTLGLDCIVEGVETVSQLQSLRGLGCHMAQGYYFARPMAIRPLLTWIRRQELLGHAEMQGVLTQIG